MAASGRAIFQAHMDGLFPESVPFDLSWTFPTGVLEVLPLTLNSGDNTITVPTGTTLIAFLPPVTNILAIKKKGAGGDTGTTLDPNQPDIHSYGGGTFILNAANTITGNYLIFFG